MLSRRPTQCGSALIMSKWLSQDRVVASLSDPQSALLNAAYHGSYNVGKSKEHLVKPYPNHETIRGNSCGSHNTIKGTSWENHFSNGRCKVWLVRAVSAFHETIYTCWLWKRGDTPHPRLESEFLWHPYLPKVKNNA